MIRHILENGLKIIFVPNNKNNKTISIGLFIKAGSRNETHENNGVAHFLEHMMFKGTTNRRNITKDMDDLGMEYNASTSYEYTFYEMHGSAKDYRKILDIMIDLYMNPLLNEKDIETERGVIIQEINSRSNDNIFDLLFKKMYKDTPLEMSIAGPKENINKLTKKDIVNFRDKYYVPKNCVLCISGKFNQRKSLKLITSKIKKNSPAAFIEQKIIINQSIPYIYVKHNKKEQSKILISFRTFSMYDDRKYAANLLPDILTNSTTSRLFNILRTKMGAIYTPASYNDYFTDNGMYTIYISTNSNLTNDVIEAVLKELKKLKKKMIPLDEFNRIKKQREVNLLFKQEKSDNLMYHYGLEELFYGEKGLSIDEVVEKYNKITPKDIKDVVDYIFQEKNINIIVMGNSKIKNKIDI